MALSRQEAVTPAGSDVALGCNRAVGVRGGTGVTAS